MDSHDPDVCAPSRREQVTDDLVARLHDAAGVLDASEREELVDDLILVSAPVAQRIAGKYAGRGCPREDLEQTAYLALVKAAQRFDASMGHHFLSYAVPCITGEVKRHFRDQGWMVRPPRPVQELQTRVQRERLRSDPTTGRPETDDVVATRLGVPVEQVHQAVLARGCFSPASLDRRVLGTVDLVLGDTLVDGRSEAAYDAAEARTVLAPALAALRPRDRELLHMRFVDELTQHEIGRDLGISQSQVSRLVNGVLAQLRVVLDEPGREDVAA